MIGNAILRPCMWWLTQTGVHQQGRLTCDCLASLPLLLLFFHSKEAHHLSSLLSHPLLCHPLYFLSLGGGWSRDWHITKQRRGQHLTHRLQEVLGPAHRNFTSHSEQTISLRWCLKSIIKMHSSLIGSRPSSIRLWKDHSVSTDFIGNWKHSISGMNKWDFCWLNFRIPIFLSLARCYLY